MKNTINLFFISTLLFQQAFAMQLLKKVVKYKPRCAETTFRAHSHLMSTKSINTNSEQNHHYNEDKAKTFSFLKGISVGALGTYIIMDRDEHQKRLKEKFQQVKNFPTNLKNLPNDLLLYGIKEGKIWCVDKALELDASVNVCDALGVPALELAVKKCVYGADIQLVEKLLERGADVSKKTIDGTLHSLGGVSLLLASVSDDNYYNEHIVSLIKVFRLHKLNFDEQDSAGRTPLMLAVLSWQDTIVFKELLASNPDISVKDREGKTVLDHLQIKIDELWKGNKQFAEHAEPTASGMVQENNRIIAKWCSIRDLIINHKK